MYQSSAIDQYLKDARSLEDVLELYKIERGGFVFWPSDTSNVPAPDYMVGYAGVRFMFASIKQAADFTIPTKQTRLF